MGRKSHEALASDAAAQEIEFDPEKQVQESLRELQDKILDFLKAEAFNSETYLHAIADLAMKVGKAYGNGTGNLSEKQIGDFENSQKLNPVTKKNPALGDMYQYRYEYHVHETEIARAVKKLPTLERGTWNLEGYYLPGSGQDWILDTILEKNADGAYSVKHTLRSHGGEHEIVWQTTLKSKEVEETVMELA